MDGDDLVFWTPSYRRDLDRFTLLRESMQRCGIDVPHVAVVPPRDVPAFRQVPFSNGLSVVSTADVLPPQAEQLRRRGERRWLPWNRLRPHASGWTAQQLVKLCGDRAGARAWVCLDSDVVFVRHIGPGDFIGPDGKVLLLEIHGWSGAEAKQYVADAESVLGLPSGSADPELTYTCPIVPFERGTITRLKSFLERRHRQPWWQVLTQQRVTEFAAYGVFARHIDAFADVHPADRRWAWLFYSWNPPAFAAEVARVTTKPHTVAVMVHSHLPVPAKELRAAVASLWPEPATGA